MDHLKKSALNFFTASKLDRLALKRRDPTWLASTLEAESSRYLPIWQRKNLLAASDIPHPISLSKAQAKTYGKLSESILLGSLAGLTYFALPVSTAAGDLGALGKWEELRWQAGLLAHDEASLAIYAKALGYWHERSSFCSDCGYPTLSKEAGHMRECTNPENKHQHFPRTDPAVIVLIHHGDSCLLGRQAVWPKHQYSTIAGFVEPGESLEDAVLREAAEETGLSLKAVHYHSSQPWSFPSSLMLGYLAEAATTEIHLADKELEDARWFSRKALKTGLLEGHLRLPSAVAISYRLIETWFDEGDCGLLQDYMGQSS